MHRGVFYFGNGCAILGSVGIFPHLGNSKRLAVRNCTKMAQIGTLVTGAAVVTVIPGMPQCEQYILIGDVDTPTPITGFQVEIDGTPFITIQGSQPLIQAFSQWQTEKAGANVGYVLKIATGLIKRNTTYRFTNAGVTTPAIYGFSELGTGVPMVVATEQINASSYQIFERFSAIFLATPANVSSLEFMFADGSKSTLTPTEAAALFTIYNQSDTDGQLSAVVCIDNTRQNIQAVKVNTGAGGACVVMSAKLPDEAYKLLTQG